MNISYSILTHNETDTLLELLNYLVNNIDEDDEIVILDDFSDDPKTKEILYAMVSMHELVFEQRYLNGHFAFQKNYQIKIFIHMMIS